MIIAYRKFVTEAVTRELRLPESADQSALGLELATVDGITYAFLPDGVDLPADQPGEIAASIQRVDLSATQREQIKAASPHCWLINQRVIEKIRARYSLDDEIKLLRTAPSAEFEAYNSYVEDCRAWGSEQKALLGLA